MIEHAEKVRYAAENHPGVKDLLPASVYAFDPGEILAGLAQAEGCQPDLPADPAVEPARLADQPVGHPCSVRSADIELEERTLTVPSVPEV